MMQSAHSHQPRITTLTDIHQKRDEIHTLFSSSIQGCLNCSDFIQVKYAVLQHFKEAIKYINKSIDNISTQHPQSHLQSLDAHTLIDDNTLDSWSSDDQHTIDQIEFQLRELSTAIDQWVFILRDCPEVEHKPNVLLLAKAMTEIFQIQHYYIYPYRKDLVPDFLNKATFNRHLDHPIK